MPRDKRIRRTPLGLLHSMSSIRAAFYNIHLRLCNRDRYSSNGAFKSSEPTQIRHGAVEEYWLNEEFSALGITLFLDVLQRKSDGHVIRRST